MALAEAPREVSAKAPRGVIAKRLERLREERLRAIMIATLKDRRVRIGDAFTVVAHLEQSILRTTVAVTHIGLLKGSERVPYLTHVAGLGRKTGEPLADLCCRLLESESAVALRISWTAGQLGYACSIIPADSPDVAAARAEAKGR